MVTKVIVLMKNRKVWVRIPLRLPISDVSVTNLNAPIVQRSEQASHKGCVLGSTPSGRTDNRTSIKEINMQFNLAFPIFLAAAIILYATDKVSGWVILLILLGNTKIWYKRN